MKAPNIRLDEGGVNQRIYSKEGVADYRRVEQASIKVAARFASPEGKRLFLRYFHSLQLHTHFIQQIGRIKFDEGVINQIESQIRQSLVAFATEVDQALTGAAELLDREGITSVASYDTVPMEVKVGLLSSHGRRFLDALEKFDRLMPMLKTLEIFETIEPAQAERRRSLLKSSLRNCPDCARKFANGLRRRANEPANPSRPASGDPVAQAAQAEATEPAAVGDAETPPDAVLAGAPPEPPTTPAARTKKRKEAVDATHAVGEGATAAG